VEAFVEDFVRKFNTLAERKEVDALPLIDPPENENDSETE
jgi:hypothetical protein